ncbi:hypothetical protein QRX60_50315 [Amycolatopsis mongoliensis]|uniref:Uncharacterized protein n=1 Tax=Amycolatopsis mongoliensis TaxID=715475 RepID=A0A9Y2NJT2_9PSEU|nr:hypothetical protein [Amycolatopsis sp. 4-36]WIY02103.1 hypothetical protein QRX60_50315 [Amycolatopsis sp. 4-36]
MESIPRGPSLLADQRLQRNALLLSAWSSGKTIVELSREFGLSPNWTGALLRKLGADVPETGRGIKCHLDENEVVDQYESGLTIREVAVQSDRPHVNVRIAYLDV